MHARSSEDPMLLQDRFALMARAAGGRPAVRFFENGAPRDLTYAEVAARAAAIAKGLGGAGVRPGDAVGVLACRHPDTVAAMLSILAAGAHYVPLDPGYPRPRLALLCEAASVRLIVSPAALPDACEGLAPALRLDRLPATAPELRSAPETTPDTPAYVMFTSGSTGTPKGVVVPHRAVLRLVVQPSFMQLNDRTVFLHLAPQTFDASTLEIWGPLLNGGLVVLYPEDRLPTPSSLRAVIEEAGVNCLWMTASLFNNVLDQDARVFARLDYVLTGGEALSVQHVVRALALLPRVHLINGYGPTENTTFTTCYSIPHDFPSDAPNVPIGTPIAGTELMIVDDRLTPVGPGEEGELLALGGGLALGYLNQPELTAERFIEVRLPDGMRGRAYRTGDRVRCRADGAIEFLGRFDDQVKIDGHRIEPDEIRRVIETLDGVRECRVLVRKGPAGQKRLVAYVLLVRRGDADLRSVLQERLPPHMVPHYFYSLDEWPTNANGKLDVSALPDPFPKSNARAVVGAGSDLVRQAWLDVLGRLPDSAESNFFDAGGTSLEAMRLHDLLEQRAAKALPPTFVFEHSTIAGQQAALASRGPGRAIERGRGALRRAARARHTVAPGSSSS